MKIYNKLIRDRIPEVIQASGKTCELRTLDAEAFLAELARKLREELVEYEESGDLAELADMMEIIHAIARMKGSLEALEELRLEKLQSRGGFEKRLLLVGVEE